ncbi:MAG TPA: sigma factor, partial [Chitinophagaceae bacterium]|nr:sigma factor [Chitinophagaceae bacterium]
MKIHDDKYLVGKFLETRSEKLFRELYRQHTPALYRLALQLAAGYQPAAEDIIQEIWVRAIQGLAGFRW